MLKVAACYFLNCPKPGRKGQKMRQIRQDRHSTDLGGEAEVSVDDG